MTLTPEDVQNKRFRTVRGPFKEGYDEEEVDAFLDEVEAELRRLLAANETGSAPAAAAATEATPVAAPAPVEEPNEAALRTLLLAQRTADDAISQAKAEAEQIVAQARVRASSIESEAQQQHAAAMGELQRQRGSLESHIDELRTFEREYRTRLKAYLEGQLHDLDSRTVAPAAPTAAAPARPAGPAGSSPLSAPSVPGIAPAPGPPSPAQPSPVQAAAPTPTPTPAAAPTPAPTPQGPASPFAPAPRLVEDMDAGSDSPLGPPLEAGEDGDVDSAPGPV